MGAAVSAVADRLDAATQAAADGFEKMMRQSALTCSNSVELRGFEPLTYSMRTSRSRRLQHKGVLANRKNSAAGPYELAQPLSTIF